MRATVIGGGAMGSGIGGLFARRGLRVRLCDLDPQTLAPLMCAGIIGYRAYAESQVQPGQRLGGRSKLCG